MHFSSKDLGSKAKTMVNGHLREELDRSTDFGEICLGRLGLVRKWVCNNVSAKKETYLVGLVEGGHESRGVGLDLSIDVLTTLIL